MQADQQNILQIAEEVRSAQQKFNLLRSEISKVIVGQQDIIQHALIALLCGGHILLEGMPGVAKTTLIKTISQALGLHFSRIQFTPDLLPADVVGTVIYNPKTQEFDTKKGPIFANFILADEINRSPAKVQSALLEAMQEKQVTIGSATYKIDQPFLVFATQNPIENEGTYQLPEAQLDRFMCKILVGYLTPEQEKEMLFRSVQTSQVQTVFLKEDIIKAQKLLERIHIDDRIINYIISIIFATRTPEKYGLKELKEYIAYGVSPRATLALYQASKAQALLEGRHFVTPDDVKMVVFAVLRHRLILQYQAEAENITHDSIIEKIIKTLPTP
ncbi:MoxR family ATPase [bacterium]|nr:MoxR family ATPase [bacterium]